MSEIYTENLIDLSADGEHSKSYSNKVTAVDEIKDFQPGLELNLSNGRDSLDNNPFDRALKLVNMLNDPFESVSQEARNFSTSPSPGEDVEIGCLVSFKEIEGNSASQNYNLNETSNNTLSLPKFSRMGSTNSNRFSSISSINSLHTPSDVDDVFTFESLQNNNTNSDSSSILNKAFTAGPTIPSTISIESSNKINSLNSTNNSKGTECTTHSSALNMGFITDNSIPSKTTNDSSAYDSAINKGFITDNTILSKSNNDSSNGCKHSLSPLLQSENNISRKRTENSHCGNGSGSDNNYSQTEISENNKHGKKKGSQGLLKLSLVNSTLSPLRNSGISDSLEQSLFSEANELSKKLSQLVTESPKEDSCDDLMAIKPNWLDSETDIDSDLEMLKIPILEEIEKALEVPKLCEKNEGNSAVDTLGENVECENGRELNSKDCSIKPSRRSLDLKALKERVELERQKTEDNSSDVNGLIENLKKIVFECSNDDKKVEANNLLESLSNILAKRSEEKVKPHFRSPVPPQIIIRQGTFDLDMSNRITEPGEQDSAKSPNGGSPKVSPHLSPLSASPNIQATVPDIVEQIGKLLGNENINVVQTNLGSTSVCSNPTYIVVMGTPAPLVRQATQIYSTEGDGSPEFSNTMRKRSQSWSLRDKSLRGQERAKMTPLKDYKTPSNPTCRKSFNNTPNVANLRNIRRSIYGPNNKNSDDTPLSNEQQNSTKRHVLATHQEVLTPSIDKREKQEIVPRKLKLKSSELAHKPRGPLKALIPAKKLVPMAVTPSISSPIEDKRKPKAITSTPVGNTTKGIPNACSTPTVDQCDKSPTNNIPKARTRYSYASATPKPKTNVPAATFSRRRSLTEIKSPKKRLESVKETGIGKSQVKAIKLPQDFVKNVSKIGAVKFTKPTRRESLLEKNKENKLPKAAK